MIPHGSGPAITIDRGNSTLDLRVGGPSGSRRRFAPEGFSLSDVLQSCERPERITAVTVVPDALAAIEDEARAHAIPFVLVGRDLQVAIEHAYPDPRELGLDRQLGAYAAHRAYGASLVVDCGTAVTWNLIDAEGRFLGGAIGLGLRSRIRALSERTPGLPTVEPLPPETFPAVTTRDALRAGVGRGFVREIEALSTDLIDAAGLGSVTRVLTGGDASLAIELGLVDFVERPELIHDGLLALGSA